MQWGQDLSLGNLAQKFEHTTLSCAHRQSHAGARTGQQDLVPGVESVVTLPLTGPGGAVIPRISHLTG